MTRPDVVHRFSTANPITDVDAENALTADQWQEMFEGIVAHEMPGHRQVGSRPRWKRLPVAALVAGALTIAFVVPTLWTHGPSGATPAAADALHRAADASRSQRALPAPGPGQYLYTRAQDRQTSMYVPGGNKTNFLFTRSWSFEMWTNQAGGGREVRGPQGITFPTAADRMAWEAAGRPDLQEQTQDRTFPDGTDTVIDLSKVPTDPDELLAAIERRDIVGGDKADWVTFQIIGELLHYCYSSPKHRAALYEVAANFPGVEYQGRVTDALGRTGDSVSYDGGGIRWQLIFDPDTAELLGERQILLQQEEGLVDEDTWPGTSIANAGPPGTVVWSEVYEQTAVVGSTASRAGF